MAATARQGGEASRQSPRQQEEDEDDDEKGVEWKWVDDVATT